MGWLDSSAHPIGIDFGAHSVRFVQLQGAGPALSLRAAARVDRGHWPEPVTAGAIAETVRRGLAAGGGFRGRSCVIALGPQAVCSRSLRLPQMPEGELPQALEWEVKDRFNFDPEPGTVAYFRAGEVRRGTEVKDELLVFAAAPDVITPYLEAFMGLGMRVQAVDLQPCATLRALARVAPLPECGAVIDMGAAGTQLTIHRGGAPAFYKYIEIGAAALDEAVAGKLCVTPEEAAQMRDRLRQAPAGEDAHDAPPAGGPAGAGAGDMDMPAELAQAVQDAMRPKVDELAREIDMCLRYYVVTFRAARPEALVAVGRQAAHGRLLEMLGTALGVTATAGAPLRGVARLTDATRPDRSAEWAAATGLALYPARAAEAAA
jgi:type IV pilus assembly protein PilM